MNLPKTSFDRDQQILARLSKIEHKVDSIEQTGAFALRAEADKHFAEVKKIFGNSVRRAQVYLAADGSRSVQEVAEYLGMKRQNVGTDLRHLADEGLLELKDSDGNRDIWAKKPLDRSLRITQFLCREFSLDRNGKPVPVIGKGAKGKTVNARITKKPSKTSAHRKR